MNDFVNSLDSVLNAALHKENQLLIQIKLELAKHFASIIQCLIRHSRLYHSIQSQYSNEHENTFKQMYYDWNRLDFQTLCDQLVDLYDRLNYPHHHHHPHYHHHHHHHDPTSINDSNWLKRVHQIIYQRKSSRSIKMHSLYQFK